MVRRGAKRRLAAAACALALLGGVLGGATAPGDVLALEQVQVDLPVVHAYFYGEASMVQASSAASGAGMALAASLGGEALALNEVRRVDAAQDSTDYIFMVDCSTSITAGQLAAVRGVVDGFASRMGPNDTVTLITFGVQVAVPVFRTADAAAVQAAAAPLAPDQPGTVLFDAMARMLELAARPEVAQKRKLCFVFTDSVDYNVGGYTEAEIEAMVQRTGIPIYAMGFDSGTKPSLDAFGALARLSGGGLWVVDETSLANQFDAALAHTQSAWVATFSAGSNVVGAPVQAFWLKAGGQRASMQVPVQFWQPDEEPAAVASVQQIGPQTLRVEFTQAVQGAGQVGSYSLSGEDGAQLALRTAAYDAAQHAVVLGLAQPTTGGTVTLAFPGVTDVSMERHPVPQVAFATSAPAVEEGEGHWMFLWWLVPLVCVTLVALVGLVAAVWGRWRAATPAAGAKAATHPAPATPLSGQVRLRVSDLDGNSRQFLQPVAPSLFVGRAPTADIVFDDSLMAPQQFVIEAKGGSYTITSLSDTHQTLVNDEPVGIAHPLHAGDIIAAGRQVMLFEPA